MIPTKEQAWDLLCEYNEGEFTACTRASWAM